jgi:hypothetical protein
MTGVTGSAEHLRLGNHSGGGIRSRHATIEKSDLAGFAVGPPRGMLQRAADTTEPADPASRASR